MKDAWARLEDLARKHARELARAPISAAVAQQHAAVTAAESGLNRAEQTTYLRAWHAEYQARKAGQA